ncbi:MAG TPA: hypothetical protein DD415_02055 [Clostridiales bacterium]|nr:hypothetical protein [Clostridiales bacterium]
MALIECSKCGGKISDSAKICPHCGHNFIDEATRKENAKEFGKLSESEQKALRGEYDSLNPGLSMAEKKVKKRKKMLLVFAVISWVLMMPAVVLLMVAQFRIDDIERLVFARLMLADLFIIFLLAIDLVVYYSLRHGQKKINKIWLRELKRFKVWLNNDKQMTYSIFFLTDKEKEIFNSFTEDI